MKDHLPLTTAMRLTLASMEQKKALLIEGFLLAHDVTDGEWRVLPDGSALVRVAARENPDQT